MNNKQRYRWLPILLLMTILLSMAALPVTAAELACNGIYKGKTLSQATFDAVLAEHQQWLEQGAKPASKGRANLCGANLNRFDLSGVDLSHANLAGADLSEANLGGINLSHANLFKTYFRWSKINDANLQSANLESATFESAELKRTNLRLAKLHYANLSDAILIQSDFRWANLDHATLNYADLTEANFTHANLSNARLSQVKIKGANFTQANLQRSVFQPILGNLPDLVSLATTENFRDIDFPDAEGMAALLELRAAYKAIGIRTMERSITAMVKIKQMQESWDHGGWGYLESTVSYLLFYLPSDFGVKPGRASLAFAFFIFLFFIPYYLSLICRIKGSGIAVIWVPNKKVALSGVVQEFVEPKKLQKTLRKRGSSSWQQHCYEYFRLARIALYFSLLSAFSIGLRELNVSQLVSRLQKRDYQLIGLGWVRMLVGMQSLLSAYLMVLWALTYFGRPFEW